MSPRESNFANEGIGALDDYLWVLKRSESDLIREIEPARMALLDEDELLALHKRVRRARNKHVSNYRRKAAQSVAEAKARGAARHKGSKDRLRAEAFEEALARVSERLAEVAHEQAEQLKAERLARAQEGKWAGPQSVAQTTGAINNEGHPRNHRKTTGGKKRDASSHSQGARRQAKRDSK